MGPSSSTTSNTFPRELFSLSFEMFDAPCRENSPYWLNIYQAQSVLNSRLFFWALRCLRSYEYWQVDGSLKQTNHELKMSLKYSSVPCGGWSLNLYQATNMMAGPYHYNSLSKTGKCQKHECYHHPVDSKNWEGSTLHRASVWSGRWSLPILETFFGQAADLNPSNESPL